jgi:hypothetical protein
MLSIKNSKAFKEDYAKMQKDISSILDENLKRELTGLLTDLLREVASVDMHHDAIAITGKMPEAIKDSRIKIASIRKKIDAKLNSYRNNNKIKPGLHSNAG